MITLKLDNFMVFQIGTCSVCEKKKCRIQKWDELGDIWICISCWNSILTDAATDEIKIDKNGVEYVTFKSQLDKEEIKETNISLKKIQHRLEQVKSIMPLEVEKIEGNEYE